MEFVALDVETANPDMASICQIGIAAFSNSRIVDEWVSLVNPETYFDNINICIHGITPEHVKNAPSFPDIVNKISKMVDGNITISHTHFDRVSINKAFDRYKLPIPSPIWLDSARVARRTWQEIAYSGYGLRDVCSMIGYSFKHHDALEDAKAAGHVLLQAINESGITIDEWLKKACQPISSDYKGRFKKDGNPDGILYGENLVFTGSLSLTRKDAVELAAKIGCNVNPGVTKKTSILVVGDQDLTKLAGKDKSSKHRKAEKLINEGQSIRILKESDFISLIDLSKPQQV